MFKKFQMSFLLFSFMVFMIMIMMLFIYKNMTYILEIHLLSINTCEFSFSMVFDKVSFMFVTIVMMISSSVFLFSCEYMKEDIYFYRFMWILLSFVLSMCFLVFSGSLLFMLVGWDGLGITSFALIIYYQSKDSLIAGFHTMLINRIGDVFIVVSFFLFVFLGHFYYFPMCSSAVTLMMILSTASLTKSAQYPFSSWLPAAMAAPTPVSALVHSSTLVTAGIFLIIRLSMIIPMTFELSNMLLLLGATTCLLGGTAAIYEFDLKKIIALSTLSQLGLMVFTLGMGLTNITLFHLFMHALFKALLFLAAGSVLLMSFGVQDMRLLGGISNSAPFGIIIFNISSFCLMGAPFLSAFYSKHMILEKMMFSSMNILSLLMISFATIMTAMYTTRMMKSLVWGKANINLILKNSSSIYFSMIMLSFFSIISGKYLWSLENWFLECVFIPNYLGFLINFFMVVGILLGMVVSVSNSFMWSTMFFLTPFYIYSGKILNPFLKNMYFLDYGWLESLSKIDHISKISSDFSNKFFSWPIYMNSFFRSFILLMMIFIYVMNY
uniref:NADH-ubiquinone oxidoreductase chain 5 n=1 Tax=Biomphalaria sudanica TaxID=112527 RepID=A0A2U8J9G3_BIOSU|nr:NADH dehydrogenase subunit 5 [Biomphalaria sudanica]AWK49470.1 NADH dehydrogenase subunit 5 [Biomphalaria sudanica]